MLNRPSVDKRLEMELSIDVNRETCEMIRASLNPDNDKNMQSECREGVLIIRILNLKIGSMYNITDDIVRCYEISKKIVE